MKNTKYSFWLPSFVALFDRLLRRSVRGSGQRWGFLKQPVLSKHTSSFIKQKALFTTCRSSSVIHHFLLLVLSVFLFSSCEKVIDVNLTEADKKVVIEGTVSYGMGNAPEVRISETKNFEDSNGFNGISGATVTIQVNNGTVYNLVETEKGIYQSAQFYGAFDSTYTLNVLLNGNTYTSVSHMPAQAVSLDSIWVDGFGFGDDVNLTIYPKYNDPLGLGNSYNLVEYRNDTLVRKAFPQNDEFSDGNTVTRPLFNPDSDLEEGDFVTVWLQCIDANVYKYWYSLDASATGNNQSAAPSNPVTNITGGALGYFSAYSATSYSMRIP